MLFAVAVAVTLTPDQQLKNTHLQIVQTQALIKRWSVEDGKVPSLVFSGLDLLDYYNSSHIDITEMFVRG